MSCSHVRRFIHRRPQVTPTVFALPLYKRLGIQVYNYPLNRLCKCIHQFGKLKKEFIHGVLYRPLPQIQQTSTVWRFNREQTASRKLLAKFPNRFHKTNRKSLIENNSTIFSSYNWHQKSPIDACFDFRLWKASYERQSVKKASVGSERS